VRKIDIGYRLGEAEQVIVGGWHWRKARSFEDVLAISTKDLIDECGGDPADRADDDFDGLFYLQTATEIALTRAGLLVGMSILGGRYECGKHEFRAAVTGLVYSDDVVGWLDRITAGTRYRVLAHLPYAPGQTPDEPAIRNRDTGVVYAREVATGIETQFIGGRETAHEIFMRYPARRSAGRQLRACWQVTVYDTEWGDSELFPFLLGEALERQNPVRA
jgi:hypothetical protein